ncbi:MAG: L,D-transpeptidase family protein [Nocardioides sp.]
MSRLPTVLLLVGLLPALGGLDAVSAGARHATTEVAGELAVARASTSEVRLDGVTVRPRANTRQVVTVNRTSGWHGRVTYWTRTDGQWTKRFRARDGRIGYNGLVRPKRRVQGSGKTPLGTYRLPFSFGTHPQRAAWDPSYRRIRSGDYWVLDNESRHYNRYRNKSRGGFRWWLPASHADSSERLRDYPKQYEFSIVTSFNAAQVRRRGGAIFLHVNGSGATAGCVSAPRWFIKRLMPRLDQDRAPVIAIGS